MSPRVFARDQNQAPIFAFMLSCICAISASVRAILWIPVFQPLLEFLEMPIWIIVRVLFRLIRHRHGRSRKRASANYSVLFVNGRLSKIRTAERRVAGVGSRCINALGTESLSFPIDLWTFLKPWRRRGFELFRLPLHLFNNYKKLPLENAVQIEVGERGRYPDLLLLE